MVENGKGRYEGPLNRVEGVVSRVAGDGFSFSSDINPFIADGPKPFRLTLFSSILDPTNKIEPYEGATAYLYIGPGPYFLRHYSVTID